MTVNKHAKFALLYVGWRDCVLARQHNDYANISIPARFTSIPQAVEMVETFLKWNLGGRHQNRVDKISCW
jgi:ribose 5-phosphate isomerase B